MISADPLPPGSVYTADFAQDGTVGVYRVEVSVSSGSGKLKMAGGVSGLVKESINRAFSYMLTKRRIFPSSTNSTFPISTSRSSIS